MEIKYPAVRRGLPRDNKVTDVILVLCKKCGYDPNNVTLLYVGGDRQKHFPKCGVKLIKPNPFTVLMYVGCGDEAIETHFQLKNGGGRAVSGNDLYQAMENAFDGGRIFLVDRTMLKDIRMTDHGERMNEKHDQEKVPVDQPTTAPFKVEFEQTPNPQVESVVVVTQPESERTIANLTNWQQPDYKGYFKDQRRVQLAVLALVTKFKVDEPFGFDEFTRTLSDEMKIALKPAAMASMVQVFTNGGYVVRFNPRESPARYAITTLAVSFATGDTPAPQLIKHRVKKILVGAISSDSSVHTSTETQAVTSQSSDSEDVLVKKIRQDEAEYQKFLEEIRLIESEIAHVNQVELKSEEDDLVGQSRSLNERLLMIGSRLAEIADIRRALDLKIVAVQDLKSQVRFQKLIQTHQKFEELRKLFTGSQ